MKHFQVRWLLRELPKLEAEGVIEAAVSERLRAHYAAQISGLGGRLVVAIFAVFGALLIGGGIILLLAHNWDAFGRGTRAAIALAPLITAQALVGWVLFKRHESTAWRESSATLLALTVAAAVALVDQTYHTGGDLESFLWRWSLLLAPLPWLVNSTAVAMLFFAALTWWAGAAKVEGSQILMMWPLAAAVVPHLVNVMRAERRGLRAANLQWAVALFLCVAAGLGLENRVPGLWIPIYVGLFALLIAVGAVSRQDEDRLWRRPLEAVGFAGSIVMWLILSFNEPWERIGWKHIHTTEEFHRMASWLDVLLAIGLPLAAIVIMFVSLDRRQHQLQFLWGLSVPLIAISWPLVAATQSELIGIAIFNCLLFVVGIATIVVGVRRQHLGVVNLGMMVVALLVLIRFFDSGFGFIVKGLAFIVVGLGFLVANVVLSRSLRAGAGGEA